jgi:endonuclease/exonuclease/phosphatase (EEP) superfamily protein YafD
MRVSIIGLIEAAAVVTVIFSIITLLPVDHHGLQLFTHFRLQYLAGSLVLLLLAKWLPNPWIIAALAITAVVNVAYLLPWYFGKPASSDETSLTLLHANVLSSNTQYQRLLDLVSREQPDIVVLQEISPAWATALQPLLQTYPFTQVEARDGNFGIALLSKMPLASVDVIESPPLHFPTIVADVAIGERSLRLVATHPMIPLGGNLFAARNEQFASLPQLLGPDTDAKLLIGDLNASMWDVHYRLLEQASGLRNARAGFGIIPTWPTYMPFAMIPIDHVLVSDAISVKDIRSGTRIGSDHLPLVVTVAL